MNKTVLTPLQKSLNVWAVIITIWSFYRANFHLPEYIDEFLLKPLVFVGVLHIYFKYFQKRSLREIINIRLPSRNDFVLIFIIAFTFILTSLIGNYFKNQVFLTDAKIQEFLSPKLGYFLVLGLFTAFSEEILSLSFIFPKLLEEWKNIYLASLLSGALFGILHIPMLFANLKLDGYTILILLAANTILGTINALLYSEKQNLLIPILVHLAYNFSVMLFI